MENPYATPQSLAVDDLQIPPRLTIRRMTALLGVGLAGGATFGALTNCINGALSPQYFRDVMDWYGPNIWLSAVGQGVLEGICYGLVYAIIFVVLIAAVSRRRCHFHTAVRYARHTFSLALGFWLLGGTIAVGFAWLLPHLCDPRFFGNQIAWPAIARYAWVRGSIWGEIYGGLTSVFLTNAIYAIRHRPADLIESDSVKVDLYHG
ncbi:MAG: hypothetical protein RIC55_25565 [Pirellulaceae bacterium]